jgi:hypothetical protein
VEQLAAASAVVALARSVAVAEYAAVAVSMAAVVGSMVAVEAMAAVGTGNWTRFSKLKIERLAANAASRFFIGGGAQWCWRLVWIWSGSAEEKERFVPCGLSLGIDCRKVQRVKAPENGLELGGFAWRSRERQS